MTYALIIHPRVGEDRVETFDSPYSMSYAHTTYSLCDISVTPTIDGEKCYAYMNPAGMRTYYKSNVKV